MQYNVGCQLLVVCLEKSLNHYLGTYPNCTIYLIDGSYTFLKQIH